MKEPGRARSGRVSLPAALCPLVLLLFSAACASAKLDVIQVGPWFSARAWREVEVFSSREQTRGPWGGIAIIHSERLGAKTAAGKLEALKLQARKKAAGMGADGIIIAVDQAPSGPEMGVYQEPELYLSALAIKYVTEVSTPASK